MLNALRNEYPTNANFITMVVTEVTHMNGKVCVAAYDIHAGRMIRPLEPTGENWAEQKWYDSGFFRPGAVVTAAPFATPPGPFPHATDDFRVQGTLHKPITLSEDDLHTLCHETADNNIRDIFGAAFCEDKYVLEGSQCRSLGCILVPKDNIHPAIPFDKLRLDFEDSDGVYYSLAVTEMATRSLPNPQAGLEALHDRLNAYGDDYPVALRVGLTRPFAGFPPTVYDPKHCILQLNGIVGPA